MARHIGYLELLLKLMFVNPPELPEQTTKALPVRLVISFVYSWFSNSDSLWYLNSACYVHVYLPMKSCWDSCLKNSIPRRWCEIFQCEVGIVFKKNSVPKLMKLLLLILGVLAIILLKISNRQRKNLLFWYSYCALHLMLVSLITSVKVSFLGCLPLPL